ncbi:hypothetical protein [Aliagarivorans taiwanensis]|uniref:hypothetical protein n=1 Tax=Aliagarivorans taiwanensis TaxID=561966 RepID=UPI0005589C58|nr:hypothetical protein [Aliagarivorans taiwanensis]
MRPVLFIPLSYGKDSTLVKMAATEAMRRTIEAGKVEPERPILINTVDTCGETIPMQMYPEFAARHLEAHLTSLKLNALVHVSRPTINDEYFIRFVGGQKLIPLPIRRADCAVILKVDTAERFLQQIHTLLPREYASSTILKCVGSRTDEGSKRSGNMAKQGIKVKTVDDLLSELTEPEEMLTKQPLLDWAPIRDWSTDDVFNTLKLAGRDPVETWLSPNLHIPFFMDHAGLLLEIYGNGSQDVCEVALNTKKKSGCNGKSRYGCFFCTMRVHDNTGEALTRYPRWNALGAENMLRVRDYLLRAAADMDARAMHARSFCPVTMRVLLQPNVLKSSYLEKIVWYISQLAVDGQTYAAEFRALVAQGREMEHPGYRDIATDPSMSEKTRAQFLQMYKERAQHPLTQVFSLNHAILLSFRWSVDGICSAAYRPLAIWRQVSQHGKRIPFPALNREWEAKRGPISFQHALPDALAIPLLQEDRYPPKALVEQNFSLVDLWERPLGAYDFIEADMNCTLQTTVPTVPAKATAQYRMHLTTDEPTQDQTYYPFWSFDGKHCCYLVLDTVSLSKLTMQDRAVDVATQSSLTPYFTELLTKSWTQTLERIDEQRTAPANSENDLTLLVERIALDLAKPFIKSAGVVGLKLEHGPVVARSNVSTSQRARPLEASIRRVFKAAKGKLIRTTSSLRTYDASTTPVFEKSHFTAPSRLALSFDTSLQREYSYVERLPMLSDDLLCNENIVIDQRALNDWIQFGGLDDAMEQHDSHLARARRHRSHRSHRSQQIKNQHPMRRYGGTHVAEQLLRTGGIQIKAAYRKQLLAILKRTHILDDAGIFDLANMDHTALTRHPSTIDMRAHRSHKAKVMLCIREKRNQRRRALKAQLASNNDAQPLLEGAQWFFQSAVTASKMTLNAGMARHLGAEFESVEHRGPHRISGSRFWLSYHLPCVNSIHPFVRMLLGHDAGNRYLRAPEFVKMPAQIGNVCRDELIELRTLIDEHRGHLAALQAFQALIECPDADSEETLSAKWASLMNQVHRSELYLFLYIPEKVKVALMRTRLARAINYLSVELERVETFCRQAELMMTSAVSRKAESMTLAARLALRVA